MAFVLGLGGGSASGKSTVAGLLAGVLREEGMSVEVLGLDRFFRREAADAPQFLFSVTGEMEFNANDPGAVDAGSVLAAVEGCGAEVLILEGHLVLAIEALRERCGLTVYVDVPDDVRAARRVARDVREGRAGGDLEAIVAYYVECARPGHEAFVGPSMEEADLVVDGMLPAKFVAGMVADAVLEALDGG